MKAVRLLIILFLGSSCSQHENEGKLGASSSKDVSKTGVAYKGCVLEFIGWSTESTKEQWIARFRISNGGATTLWFKGRSVNDPRIACERWNDGQWISGDGPFMVDGDEVFFADGGLFGLRKLLPGSKFEFERRIERCRFVADNPIRIGVEMQTDPPLADVRGTKVVTSEIRRKAD